MPTHQSAITSHFHPGTSPAGPSNPPRRSFGNIRSAERHSPGNENEVDSDDLDAIQLGTERRAVDSSLLSMTQKRAQRRAVYASSDESSSKEEDEEEGESDREARRQRQKARRTRREKKRKEAEEGDREGLATDEDEYIISIPADEDKTPKRWPPGRGGSGSAGNGGRQASGGRKRVVRNSDDNDLPARQFSGKRRRGLAKGTLGDLPGSEEEPPRPTGGLSAPRLVRSQAVTRRIFGSSDEEQDNDVVPLHVPRTSRHSPPRPAPKSATPTLADHSGDSPEIVHSNAAGEPLLEVIDISDHEPHAAPLPSSPIAVPAAAPIQISSPPTSSLPTVPSPPPPPPHNPPLRVSKPPTTYTKRRSPQRPPPLVGPSSSIASLLFSIEVPPIPRSQRALYHALELGQEASPAAPEAGAIARRNTGGDVEDGSPVASSRPTRASRTSVQVKATAGSKGKGKEKEVISISDTDNDGDLTPKSPSKRHTVSPARRPPPKKRVLTGREGRRGPRRLPIGHRREATPPIGSESESEEEDLYNFGDLLSEEEGGEGRRRRKGARARAEAGTRPRARPHTGPCPAHPRAPARRHSSPTSRSRRSEDMLADISLDQPERFSFSTRLRERKETVQQRELRRLAAKRRGEAASLSVTGVSGSDKETEGGEEEESEEESEAGKGRGKRGGRGRGRGSPSSSTRQSTPIPPSLKKRRQSTQKQRVESNLPRHKQPPLRPRHRLRPRIVDPDEEESGTVSLSRPAPEDEQAETEEEEDMVQGLRMDSPERFQSGTRLRGQKKETANQRQLRKLKAKREGKAVVTTDEEDDEGWENEQEGVIDVDGEEGSPEYIGSDEDLPAAPGNGYYDDEDDGFIDDTEDVSPLSDGFLPNEFSLTRQAPEFKFKVVFHYLLFLVIHKEQALSLNPNDRMYFIPPLKDLRRKIQDYKNSGVRSQVWKVKFVKALETYPVFNATTIDPEPGCDACRIAGRVSKWRAYLEGDIYDHTTHGIIEQSTEDDDDDDDEMEDESPKLPRSLLLGKYCRARAQVYHEMSHWEHLLYISIRHRYHNLLRAKGRSVPADDNSIASASENEEDEDFEAYQRRSARASRADANQRAVERLVQRGNLPERTKNVDEVMEWMDKAGYVKEELEWFESFDGKGQQLERDWGKNDK